MVLTSLLLLFIIIIHYYYTVIHYHRRGGEGTYHKKAMRLDHVFVSRKLIDEQNIIDCRILGHGYDKAGFLGSDHCPIKVVVSIK
jgi:exonuclease III